jgi:hypothetical protein
MPAKSAQREDATPAGWYSLTDAGGDVGGTESVMGPMFAAAAGPVKLHTDLPIMTNQQVRVHYQ